MPSLELFLLGSPRVEHNGRPIQVDTRKAIALLAYLAVTGESHRRDALADLLWPNADQTRARAALRRTLSTVNKALRGEGLRVDRETIGIDWRASPFVDVIRFRAHLAKCLDHAQAATDVCDACRGPLTQAAELYAGDFLAGFTLRDSANFDDWQSFQTESLRTELAGVLERLVKCQALRGDLSSAVTHARRWLGLDPLNEQVHCQLMVLYARSDQRAAALRQYRECVRVLDRDLGVTPLDETTQLYQAIRENRTLSALAASPLRSGPPIFEPETGTSKSDYPLVGRSSEWGALLETYASVRADGRFIVIEGEAGIGKSRLAEEFLAHLRAKGAVTVSARCYRGEANLAFGPFVEGLRDGLGRLGRTSGRLEEIPADWLTEAGRLLPELARSRPELPTPLRMDNPLAQSRFFEAVGQILLEVCRGPAPGVFFIDDLHWADDASVELLAYLLRRLPGRPFCIVTTWRREEMGAQHRLRLLAAEAERSGLATTLSPNRLSLTEVTELVRATSGNLPDGIEKRLHRETEGLPLFLVEYLATFLEPEASAEDEWAVPASVRELLEVRLAALPGPSRQLLDTAAVIGRSFDFDTLQEAGGRGEEETVMALEGLMAAGLVNELTGTDTVGRPVYDFTHDRLRSLAYEETSLARRRLLHRRVAGALTAGPRPGWDSNISAALIAQHYRMAGEETEAARYFKLAGDHARSLFANTEALGHYGSALVLGSTEAAELHEAIGDLHTLSGTYGDAVASYEMAAALSNKIDLARVERKLGSVYHRQGQWDIAESHFEAAVESVAEHGDPGHQARTYADWSLTAHRRGDPARALQLATNAAERAEEAEDTEALAQAYNVLGILSRTDGDSERATQNLRHSLALAETLSDPSGRVAALNNLALAQGAIGEFEEAITLAQSALELCALQGDRHREAAIHNNLADLYHAGHRPEAAMSHLRQAVTIFAEIGEDLETVQPEIWKLVEW